MSRRAVRTGAVWRHSPRSRAQIVRRVCDALEAEYGLPRHGNPTDPVDDLVYVVLSTRTPLPRAQRAYEALKEAYPDWSQLVDADADEVATLLAPAGLSERKAEWLKKSLSRILDDFGSLHDPALWSALDAELIDYLTALPGVSDKVARCVMAYALDRPVLAVDVHVHRVSSRLGWTAEPRPEKAHDELEALIPPHRRHAYHVCCVAHGQHLCLSRNPQCGVCPVQHYCLYAATVKADAVS